MREHKREIAFIDPGVDDLLTLLAGIRPDVEPILLTADEPAPRQMARAVKGREGLEAIHVIAHGKPGEISFSFGSLSVETLPNHMDELGSIGAALAGGELPYWSVCWLGAQAAGPSLVADASARSAEPLRGD